MGKPPYTGADIGVSTELDAVRKRPGMYVGSIDESGIHHMVLELIGNVVDLHLAGCATILRVDLADTSITISDDGPGFEPAKFEEAFTTVHYAGTLDAHWPHVHLTSTMLGVGVAIVNALSESLLVESTYEGVRRTRTFSRGKPTSATRVERSNIKGTSVRFQPDRDMFGAARFQRSAIESRLRQLASLVPRLEIVPMASSFQAEADFLAGQSHSRGRTTNRSQRSRWNTCMTTFASSSPLHGLRRARRKSWCS